MRGGVRGRGEDVYQRVQTPCRLRARRSRARSRMRPCACIIRRAEKTLSKNHCRTAAIAPPTISRRRHYITGAPPGRVATATDDIQRTISQLSTVTRARLHFCGNNRGKKTAIDTPVTAATCWASRRRSRRPPYPIPTNLFQTTMTTTTATTALPTHEGFAPDSTRQHAPVSRARRTHAPRRG